MNQLLNEPFVDKALNWLSIFGLKFISALAVLVFGLLVSKVVRKILDKLMKKKHLDPTITSFISSLTYFALMIFVIVAALAQLGIQTASIMTVIGAAGLAIGLALQGSLSNFAAGFLMIVLRPFKVGDYVDAGGTSGTVKEISIFTTEFNSIDNKKIIVPNSKIMNDNIINYTAENKRRVDLVIGFSYEADIDKARAAVETIIQAEERIFSDPAPIVKVMELGGSSVNFTVRVWTKTQDYWEVRFNLLEKIKKKFDKEGIGIPYPQMDVHIKEKTAK